MDVGPDYGDGRREVIAEATIFSILGGNRNETGAIRNLFLREHGIGVPSSNPYAPRRWDCDSR